MNTVHIPLSIFLRFNLLVDMEYDGGPISIFPNENVTIMQTRDDIIEIIRDLKYAVYPVTKKIIHAI